MIKKLYLFFLIGLFSYNSYSNSEFSSFFGSDGKRIVCIRLSDSLVYVEYCFSKLSGDYFSSFDTLRLIQNKYVGTFSEVSINGDNYCYKPGKIHLTKGKPDSSLNIFRNEGYLAYVKSKFAEEFKWTGADLSEFNLEKWNLNEILNLTTDSFRKILLIKYNTLRYYYISGQYVGQFEKVIIKNSKLVSSKVYESNDSLDIKRIWQFFSKVNYKKRNMAPYYFQLGGSVLLATYFLGMVDYGVIGGFLIYPALIGTEVLIDNRLHANSTYKVIFQSKDKKVDFVKLKIRHNRILGNNYVYILPFDFDKYLTKITQPNCNTSKTH